MRATEIYVHTLIELEGWERKEEMVLLVIEKPGHVRYGAWDVPETQNASSA